ncbi:MAG: winged helix-turn-helix transcriptional regulator [Candidatus Delongbacteria bacterium]|nr:winged helix-turn-helix transcriptional regulator [Candidatus Delongbacteria bacterium]MBN2836006.1 winged helix-turn-helix transcriptional regulator [Candidatus Delongbacteria bacterium]
MNIDIKTEYSIVVDFILSIARIKTKEIGFGFFSREQEMLERFKPDENLNKIIRKIEKDIPEEYSDLLTKYFSPGIVVFKVFIYLARKEKIKDVNEFISYLENMDKKAIAAIHLYLFSSVKKNKIDMIPLEKAFEKMEDIQNLLNLFKNTPLSGENKWNIIEFYQNPDKVINDIIVFFKWYNEKLFFQFSKKIDRIATKYSLELEKKVSNYGAEYIENLLNIDYSKYDQTKNIRVTISFFSEIGYIFFIMGEDEDFYVLGYRHMEVYAERKHDFLSIIHLFKTLGDETRLNIIKKLASEEMYGDELAKALNLSNSTISYHINMLIMEGIVKLNRVEKKSYLALNKDRLIKLLDESYNIMTGGVNEK